MNQLEIAPDYLQLNRYITAITLTWLIVITASLAWNITHIKHGTEETAYVQAQAAFDKDILFRRWATGHGGVYVPVTEQTQPNPYLDVAERDITTPSGKLLTLMNPAYMTRQIYELAQQQMNVRGHITSLKPIRPANVADAWETRALQDFENGKTEFTEITQLEDKEYLRLMRPLITEKGCLRCHEKQGYHEGDVRGGISIAIPMQPLREIENTQIETIVLAHGLIGLLGLVGTGLGARELKKSEKKRAEAEALLRFQRNHDILTGIYNRTFFEEEMNRLAQSRMFPVSIVVADLDGLKQANDTLGHAAGDELIRQAAIVLKASFRVEDIVTRTGGDEFAILLPSTNTETANDLIARVKAHLANHNATHQTNLRFSLGAATAMQKSELLPEVLKRADESMYKDKQTRKQPKF